MRLPNVAFGFSPLLEAHTLDQSWRLNAAPTGTADRGNYTQLQMELTTATKTASVQSSRYDCKKLSAP